jgi:AraC-like DNA-binding protein
VQYDEGPPIAALADVVQCVWTLDGHARELGGALQPVFPDGRPELIVHLGDPFDRVEDNLAPARQPLVILAGQLTGRLVLSPTGHIATVGIRFHPHGASAFVRESQQRLVGETLDAADVCAPLARAAAAVQRRTSSVHQAAALLQTGLASLRGGRTVDPRVAFAASAIVESAGQISVDAVAARSGTTRRHLERLFLTHVGLTPKRLARTVRFQRALAVLEHGGGSGAATAAECGYADQAHFIREFRELAGCAPGAHLLDTAALTGFFSSGAWLQKPQG